uniref:Ig-like domain-containing protein n=1 Tax=Gadus morhua TaxID=8049 RepID=A0A8C5BTT7_GADMO
VYGTHGKNTTFTTTIKPTSDPFFSVSWAVNGSFIITSTISNTIVEPKYADRTTLFRETGSLELRNLTNEDSGEYTVTIIPASGHLISGAAVLEVQCEFVLDHNHPFLSGSSVLVHPGRRSPDGPDTPTVQQHPNPAVEEERLTLSCASDSLPPAAFTWEFQRRPLVPGPQHVIAELDEDHLGNYTCTARNDLTGLVVSTVHTVSVTPNTTELLEFNSSVRISCHVSTGTSLSYLWMNGSSEITVSSDRVQVGDGGTSLTILNVTRYDRGPYTCNVSNPVSNDVGRPLTLTIGYGPERLAIIGPSLVEFGEVTVLYCSAMSVPPPSYTWSLNGVHTTVQGPVYVIASVNSSDYGKYTCTAVNTLTDLSQAADHVVSLKGKPKVAVAVNKKQ